MELLLGHFAVSPFAYGRIGTPLMQRALIMVMPLGSYTVSEYVLIG